MPAKSHPVLLDISRSISRAGHRQLTGIDRVERSYLREFLLKQDSGFLARVPGGTFVLAHAAAAKILALLESGDVSGVDWRSRLSIFRDERRKAAETIVRRFGVPVSKFFVPLAARFTYVNVGHSNLRRSSFDDLRRRMAAKIVVMVHDTIPMDFPQWSRLSSTWSFPAKLKAAASADLVICNSQFTEQSVRRWFRTFDQQSQIKVVNLGVERLTNEIPTPTKPARFLVLGTIEPRKNHALLLAVWDDLRSQLPTAEMPHLDIVGARGWRNRQVFRRLDNLGALQGFVHEYGPIDDVALADLMRNSSALLFPSMAEGFGLPVLECLSIGLPVICSDLPVLREVAGGFPTFVEPNSIKQWLQAVQNELARPTGRLAPQKFLTWGQHFARVNELIAALRQVDQTASAKES